MTIPSWAKVGAKVVCVNADSGLRPPPPGYVYLNDLDGLTKGEIYTIRAVGRSDIDGAACLWLSEILRPLAPDDTAEVGFFASRFRPLISKSQSQDVELFTHLLNSTPADLEGMDA